MSSPQPGNRDQDQAPARIDPEALIALLTAHRQWLESNGQNGARADLRGTDLSGVDLKGADLRHADLRGAKLEDTQLQNAALCHADLSDATCLLSGQLAGTDLSGATLPLDIDVLDRLSHIEEVTDSGRKVFFVMLLAVAYTWLTIATTSDVALLTNAPTSPLPIIMTELPISGFYWAAPLILLGFYLYFHLHMQRLWEDLAALPAFFPDGLALYDKAHPWLLTGLVNAHCVRLQSTRPPMSRTQNFISIVLAWYVIPITIGALWLRYLPRHDWVGTGFHIIILMIAGITGSAFYRLAISTLEGKQVSPLFSSNLGTLRRNTRALPEAILFCLAFILLPVFSFGAIAPTSSGATIDPRAWVTKVFNALGYSPFATVRDQDVSIRPNNWSERAPPFDDTKGAKLRGGDLHHADASGAFLVKADLREANLQGANLELADLRRAKLQDANLREASLLQADLRESDLARSDLRGAVLLRANLNGAILRRANLRDTFLNGADLHQAELYMADLRGARLNNADLQGADLELAIFGETNLQGANLTGTKGLNCAQLASALVNADTRLPEGLQCQELKQ